MGSNPVAVTQTSDIAPVSGKEFLDIQATKECRFTLKRVCDMIRIHSPSIHACIFCFHIIEKKTKNIFSLRVLLPALHNLFIAVLFRGSS